MNATLAWIEALEGELNAREALEDDMDPRDRAFDSNCLHTTSRLTFLACRLELGLQTLSMARTIIWSR